jgi:DNA-binding MarR family transcriptional regulator
MDLVEISTKSMRYGGNTISELKNEILREVGMLARCIHSISDIKYREIRLQRGQFIYLTRVCEHPGISLMDLSQMLKVDKTTTTKAVQKLLEENYVRKERDCTDKRVWHLFPAEKALEVYPYIIHEENRYIDICFQGFTREERVIVHRLCRRMRENIEQDWVDLKQSKGE